MKPQNNLTLRSAAQRRVAKGGSQAWCCAPFETRPPGAPQGEAGCISLAWIMSAVASTLPIQAMKIEKVKDIGAIVTGIDLAQPIDGVTPENIL
jgi:hypothetical protein